jgi:propionyl-CoA carboxylase alpha chain
MKLRIRGEDVTVKWKQVEKDHYQVEYGGRAVACRVHTRANAVNQIALEVGGVTRTYDVQAVGDQIFVQCSTGSTIIERLPRHPRPASASESETEYSPMPGQVLRILVEEGQHVKAGDSLVVLEAMKMEQTIRTTINGRVQSVLVKAGQVVAPGQMLVQISALESES